MLRTLSFLAFVAPHEALVSRSGWLQHPAQPRALGTAWQRGAGPRTAPRMLSTPSGNGGGGGALNADDYTKLAWEALASVSGIADTSGVQVHLCGILLPRLPSSHVHCRGATPYHNPDPSLDPSPMRTTSYHAAAAAIVAAAIAIASTVRCLSRAGAYRPSRRSCCCARF